MSVRIGHSAHDDGRGRRNRKLMFVVVLVLAIAGLVYLAIRGSTRSWPEASCTITGSRVVRTDVRAGPHGAPVPMYQGEYQLRYTVKGHDYFVWTDSGWLDVDREFVENRVSSAPVVCEYVVRYNPAKPAEAVAQRR